MSDSTASSPRVVLLGPPASGKGTQGRRLANSLRLGYLSTGALLREQMENRTALGMLADPLLARGSYLPDDLMCRLLDEWLSVQKGGWVLDGFPRSLPQAEFLDHWLAAHGLAIDRAVSLEVPHEILILRIRDRVECPECRWSGQKAGLVTAYTCPVCGSTVEIRADDTEENFNQRYQEFTRLTAPVIEHYRRLERLVSCDATAPQDEVSDNILKHFS